MGRRSTVLAFKALGLDTFPVDSDEDAKRTFSKLTEPDEQYAVIYLEEDFSLTLSSEIARFNDKVTPAIILIDRKSVV